MTDYLSYEQKCLEYMDLEYSQNQEKEETEALERYTKSMEFFEMARILYVLDNLDRLSDAISQIRDEPLFEWFSDYGVFDDITLEQAYNAVQKRLENLGQLLKEIDGIDFLFKNFKPA